MLLVKKFGGTSVGNIDRIRNTADIIKRYAKNGDQIIIVISAMSGDTDEIYKKCSEIHPKYHREYDQALVIGEQIAASLLVMALENLGLQAKSYNCWNLPIYGDGEYGDGFITEINTEQLKSDLDNQIIPVITGFQAIKKTENRAITLGRGGSDYSAVMIAAALNADICYIYTDVSGVYNADPHIISEALKLDELSYDEIIEIADSGAKVLQLKSVIAAKKYTIYMKILSSFDQNKDGTTIASNILLKRDRNLITLNCKHFTANIMKITIFSLNNGTILDIEEMKNLLISKNIEPIGIDIIKNNKIELLMRSEDKENCLKSLFALFSIKHS